MKKHIPALLIVAVLLLGAHFIGSKQDQDTPVVKTTSHGTTATINKQTYSLTDPNSPWVVINKKRPLSPIDYTPADLTTPDIALRYAATNTAMQLRKEAASALGQMNQAALKESVHLKLYSGYRSYAYQKTVYASEVNSNGQGQADRESARPGYSEHQTGWAADLVGTNNACPTQQCFATTIEGKWLATNAYKYGFIVRYPQSKQSVTGYEYEPWHIRYVGTGLARDLHNQGIQTLEEFFKLPAAADY
jgi:zinc D-Ala-D-Ala carboxypeptidase